MLEMVSAHIPLEIRLSVEIKFQFKDAGVYNGTDPKTRERKAQGSPSFLLHSQTIFPSGQKKQML